MAKRRTSGIQRRSRASEEAMGRRLGAGTTRTLDWRLLTIGAILLLGLVILLLVLLFGGGGGNTTVGDRQADAGRTHIAEGTAGSGYTSVPATSGPHWSSADSPGPWGVYTVAQPQERMIHNLEHGGIVIWYQPALISAEDLATLTQFVKQQITGDRFKVILTPWSGANFDHAIALTAWDWLLYMDTADLDTVRAFIDAHILKAPESNGGPARPAS
ncbi:MAG TPA: DUF3105 domain-containing protein [Candidatus Limnocylindria bacterium]|nr:DUF3105 domain-containing protein [Candidatus Limnocylindria bacterium]